MGSLSNTTSTIQKHVNYSLSEHDNDTIQKHEFEHTSTILFISHRKWIMLEH